MGNFRGRAFSSIFSSEINEDQFNDTGQKENLSLVQENNPGVHDEQYSNDKQGGLIDEKSKFNREVEHLEKQSFKDELKNEKEKIVRLEDDLKNKCDEIKNLKDQLETKTGEIELLQNAITDKDNLVNNAEAKLKEQLEVYELKVSTLNEKLEFSEEQVKLLKKEIEEFESRPEEEAEPIETVIVDVNEISSTQEELAKAQEKIRNLEDQLDQSLHEFKVLEGFVNKIGLDGGAGELKKAQKVIQQLNYIIQKQKEFIKEREEYITRIKIGIRETTEQLLNENTPPYLDVTTETLPVMEEFVTIKEQEQFMTKIISHMQFIEENFSRKLEEEKTIKNDLENEKLRFLEKVDYFIDNLKTGEAKNEINSVVTVKNANEEIRDITGKSPAAENDTETSETIQNEVSDDTASKKSLNKKAEFPQKLKGNDLDDQQMDEIIKKIATEELENFQTIYEKNFSLEEMIKIVKSSIESIPIKKLKGEQLNNEERRLNGKLKEYTKLLAVTA